MYVTESQELQLSWRLTKTVPTRYIPRFILTVSETVGKLSCVFVSSVGKFVAHQIEKKFWRNILKTYRKPLHLREYYMKCFHSNVLACVNMHSKHRHWLQIYSPTFIYREEDTGRCGTYHTVWPHVFGLSCRHMSTWCHHLDWLCTGRGQETCQQNMMSMWCQCDVNMMATWWQQNMMSSSGLTLYWNGSANLWA